jgi:RNA polymerase sigma factor (sigma-70 family)
MTRDRIISSLYTDKDITDAINKMHPEELRDDLRQEMFMVLLEMPEQKLKDRHSEGSLKWYLIRTMLNMIKSDRSNFYMKFRRCNEELTEKHDIPDTSTQDELLDKVNDIIETVHWYEREILRLHTEQGKTFRAISNETKIPYRSILETMKNTKHKLKKMIRNGTSD